MRMKHALGAEGTREDIPVQELYVALPDGQLRQASYGALRIPPGS